MTSTRISRRSVMTAAAALGAGAALGSAPAAAAAPMLGASQPVFRRFRLGAFEVTTILDGAVPVPGPHPIFGENADPAEVEALARANFLPADKMEIGFTVTVVNTGAQVVVFDAGNGGDTGRRPRAGLLLERLAAAGFAPEQIDVVAMTHFHPDHIGGLKEAGAVTFPNARYVFGAQEFDFWRNEDLLFDERRGKNAELVQANVVPHAEAATMVAPGDTVVGGIEAVKSWGHTPGHTAYHVDSEGQRLMIIGDVCNHYVASLQRPDWHVRFDMDKEMAVASRKEILGMIAADRIPFVGYHMPFPAVGYLEAQGQGFRFVPASYQFSV